MYEDIKRVCLYARFSSHNQTEQSIEGQVRVCTEFCQKHGFHIVETYVDRATSAAHDIEKRTSFLKMISDSAKDKFQAVVVYKLDRFSRSRYDAATYKYRLKKNGVALISATENITDTPEGIILESVLEGMAEFYSAELSQKITRGLRESALKQNVVGGQLPLGYKIENKKYVIDENTAPIVREAFQKYADGETVAEICREFNLKGYKSSKGAKFGKCSFTRMFKNEKYIGTYIYDKYKFENAIPAIIDKKTWRIVQARMNKQKMTHTRGKQKYHYLLTGKIFCGHCGYQMSGNTSGSLDYGFYQCYGKSSYRNNCNKKNIRKETIEELVVKDALSLLTDERIKEIAKVACSTNKAYIQEETNIYEIKGKLHEVEVSLSNITKAIESGEVPATLVKRMNELEAEKRTLLKEQKKESADVVQLDEEQVIYWLSQFKDGDIKDEEFCRNLIDLFVNSVTVWDEPDRTQKVVIAYNLQSENKKTYRLNSDGKPVTDMNGNTEALNSNPLIVSGVLLHSLSIGKRNPSCPGL